MPRLKSDPLLAALIKKLPQPGNEWPVDQQLAWLHMVAVAFRLVYGGDASERLNGAFNWEAAEEVSRTVPEKAFHHLYRPPVQPKAPKAPKGGFYIDDQGMVRNAQGKRVLPKDVTSEVYDTRGEMGDMKAIVWADDSKGLNGADLTITSA